MYRVSAFILGVFVCLWVMTPVLAQKDPKPYDDSKPKKSSAKSDTSKTKEESKARDAKPDTTKAKEKSKARDAKPDTTKTKEKSKTKDAGKKKSKTESTAKESADKKSKAATTKKKEAKAEESQTAEKKAKDGETKRAALKTADTENAKVKTSRAGQPIVSNHIARALFTNAVVEREPADTVDSLTTDFDKIYFFTEIVGMQGKQVTHQWIYDGQVVVEVPFHVGGPRWRVYSSKKLLPSWVGRWTVAVIDETGKKLHEDSFAYVGAAQ